MLFDIKVYNEYSDDNLMGDLISTAGITMPKEIIELLSKEMEFSQGIAYKIAIGAEVFVILGLICNVIEV